MYFEVKIVNFMNKGMQGANAKPIFKKRKSHPGENRIFSGMTCPG